MKFFAIFSLKIVCSLVIRIVSPFLTYPKPYGANPKSSTIFFIKKIFSPPHTQLQTFPENSCPTYFKNLLSMPHRIVKLENRFSRSNGTKILKKLWYVVCLSENFQIRHQD